MFNIECNRKDLWHSQHGYLSSFVSLRIIIWIANFDLLSERFRVRWTTGNTIFLFFSISFLIVSNTINHHNFTLSWDIFFVPNNSIESGLVFVILLILFGGRNELRPLFRFRRITYLNFVLIFEFFYFRRFFVYGKRNRGHCFFISTSCFTQKKKILK